MLSIKVSKSIEYLFETLFHLSNRSKVIFCTCYISSILHILFHTFFFSKKNKHLGKLMLSKHFDRILQLSITYPTSVSSNTFLYIQIEFFTKSNMEGKQLLSIY